MSEQCPGKQGHRVKHHAGQWDKREQKRSDSFLLGGPCLVEGKDNKTNEHTDLSPNCRKLDERKIWVVRRGSDEELT